MSKFILGILSDSMGSPSSKRVVAILCTILMTISFIANLFWGYRVDQDLFDGIMYVVIGSLGITGAEKFASKTIVTE